MTLFMLDGYSGQAEILGALKRVTYGDTTFSVHGLSLHEANRILDLLAAGQLHGIRPGDDERKASAAIFEQRDGALNGGAGPTKTKQPVAPTTPKQAAEPADEPADVQKLETATAEEDPVEPPRRRGRPAKLQEAPPADKSAKRGNGQDDVRARLLSELQTCTTFRAVAGALIEHGYNTEDSLLEACRQLQGEVPLLGRVTNMEQRVARMIMSTSGTVT
jgi:hypothetical protein